MFRKDRFSFAGFFPAKAYYESVVIFQVMEDEGCFVLNVVQIINLMQSFA